MRHKASPRFWACYYRLPEDVQRAADAQYALLCQDPYHPSLHLKRVGRYWSARVGLHHRALAVAEGEYLVWFWIGPHDEYERLLGR